MSEERELLETWITYFDNEALSQEWLELRSKTKSYLAKPEPEPIGYTSQHQIDHSPKIGHDPVWWFEKYNPEDFTDDDGVYLPFVQISLYTTPPRKELSDEEISAAIEDIDPSDYINDLDDDYNWREYSTVIARAVLKAALSSNNINEKRYNWLRAQSGWPESECAVSGLTPDEFDAMIDKLMRRAL